MMSCNDALLQQDPVWQFDPKSTMAEVMSVLDSDRDVTRHLYSFEKRLVWENGGTKAYLRCTLGMPVFEDGKLNACRYTVTADNMNRPVASSEDIYALFKRTWITAFGDPAKEQVDTHQIVLKWRLKDDIDLLITADRRFDNYMVEYNRRN